MVFELSRRSAVCPEYQNLLYQCQRALATLQRRRTQWERGVMLGRRAYDELYRLQGDYARAYSFLEMHEHSCQACQYLAKLGGLDFESMSETLLYRKQSA